MKQPEALHHADYIEYWNPDDPIAKELRRLHEANQAMLEALKDAKLGLDWYQSNYPESIEAGDDEVMESIVSAIDKGEAGNDH